MGSGIPTYSIRAANDRGISNLLDELKDTGQIVLTKYGQSVAILSSVDPEVLSKMDNHAKEKIQATFEERDQEMGKIGVATSLFMVSGLRLVKEEDNSIGEELGVVHTVTTANQRGISWTFKTAEQLGLLVITRYNNAEALVLPLTPDGLQRYSDRLIEMATHIEDQALTQLNETVDQLRETVERARRTRKIAVSFRDYIAKVTKSREENEKKKNDKENTSG